MINPSQQRAYHKAQLYRLLIRLLDDPEIASNIFFKGGTCSTMLGFLDRFSVDLDFDLKKGANKNKLRKKLYKIFNDLNLKIKDESKNTLQFFLLYQVPEGQRNTIKMDILDTPFKAINYYPQYLKDIDRIAICQTKESIVANKLVAITDSYKKRKTIAGRDVYDIHFFLSHGFSYRKEIIKERTKKSALVYLQELKTFVSEKITQKIVNQDLNFLLSYKQFNSIRKTLKTETLMLIGDEIKRLEGK